jgi:beta-lactam-binding protein with PASTA domain
MKRFFNILLTALAMLAVFLLSAFLAMRLAIHGREVEVPNLAGLTLQEASDKAGHLGLSLRLENKFYSADVPSGHILGQFPAPGATVRSEWAIRVTESIGSQQVSIPDVTGQPERPASLALRRSSLELGAIASISAPGDPGIVLAQTPPPNASGVDRPRVSLLLSQPASASPQAFVMPQLTGLSLSAAFARTNAAGLRIAAAEEPAPTTLGPTSTPPGAAAPGTPGYHDSFFVGAPAPTQTPATTPIYSHAFPVTNGAPAVTSSTAGTVTGQSPLAGHRVMRGECVRLTITH